MGYVMVDGELHPARGRHVSALDRGFTLGDGVFETIRVAAGRAFRLPAHLARLRRSAAALHLPVTWGDDALSEAVAEVSAANRLADAVVRITVSRGVATERGLLPPSRPVPTVAIQASPFRELSSESLRRGLSAVTSSIRRNETSPISRIKSCNYLDGVLARLEAQRAGADDAIMLNTSGYLACCSAANLHLVCGGRIQTPALACGVLAGITRQVVRELAASLGLRAEEAWLRPADLWAADEAFLTNSVLGIAPLTRVDGRGIGTGQPGPIAAQLRIRYEALVCEASQGG